MTVSLGLAFLAGLASFLSPCVFSLVPAYVSYMSGRSAAAASQRSAAQDKLNTFFHGFAFVLGFSLVFISLGLVASLLGQLMYNITPILAKIGGVVVILFGLHMTGIFRIPFLEYDLRPQTRLDQRRSYFSSFLMGIFFSAGWSPCVGPTLGVILTLAATGESLGQGVLLLAVYSLGLAVPFLIAALGIGWVTFILRKYRKAMHYVEVGMGVVMVIVGVLLFLGTFQQLAQWAPWIDLGL